jgi:outer membrane receptor protein involved in Fe transport
MSHHRSFRYAAWFSICCLLFWMACSHPAMFAQSTSATLNGMVVDQTGAVVPDTLVSIFNPSTGLRRQVATNKDGSFIFPMLPPATYTITTQHDGFSAVQMDNIILNVDDRRLIQITLKVGQVNTAITVTEESSLISSSSSVGTVINRQFVGNLPLNGRSFQALILLTPGVTVSKAGTGEYGQFSVNGQRASTNYFTVDGVSANVGSSTTFQNAASLALAGSYPGLSVFGGTNNLVSVDALEEFKIQTSSSSAEFGRQPGGQVSIVTRSGTNQFHGNLFEYFRNDALDAADWFTNAGGLKKPALRQNQFGGTFSGPIVIPGLYNGHDRTFFFFSYEGQRLRLPKTGITYVPSMELRSAAATAGSTVLVLLNAFPQPTGAELLTTAGVATGWAPYNYGVSNPSTMDAYSLRMDHTISSKLTLFGRFNQSPSNSATYAGGAYHTVLKASTQTWTLGVISVLTARLSNEFRINYSRQLGGGQYTPTTLGGAVPVDLVLLNNGLGGFGMASFSFNGYGGGVYAGEHTKNYQRQINVVDNISLVRGAHQFKFGIDYRRLSPTYGAQTQQGAFFNTKPVVTASTATFGVVQTYIPARLRYNNYSFYGQDTWKVTPRLTLDYGLRWELNPVPSEADGKMPAIAIGITGIDVSKATLAPTGTPFYRTFYRAFAPRAGVSYQLNQASGRETVLRGGFGVYYDLGSNDAASGYPLYGSKITPNVPWPLSAENAARPPSAVPTSLPTTSQVYTNAENLKLPYALHWNVAVEQSLGTQQTLSVSYVASASRRLLTSQYLNYAVNGVRPNPNFSTIVYTYNGPTSDYNSMQVQYKARLKRGMQALVNYTWAHAIDDVSVDLTTSVLTRGNADFDVRHNLSSAVTYDLPTPNGPTVLKQLLGHWSVDGIVHAQSGLPLNVTTGSYRVIDTLYLYVRPNYVSGQPLYVDDPKVAGGRRFNTAAFTTPTTGQGNFGRNVMRGLQIWQADFGLGRSFSFTERWKLRFKGELFNIFNHPNFGAYGTTSTVPSTFGVPTQTMSSSMGGLNSLYQMGGPRSVQLSLKLSF